MLLQQIPNDKVLVSTISRGKWVTTAPKLTKLTPIQVLDAMGVEQWRQRTPGVAGLNALCQHAGSAPTTETDTKACWQTLQQRVAACQACALSQQRTQTVFGVGNRQADALFVGEAPGFHEDKQGEPFVGRAGQLLTAMLAAIGLTREDVFIANILKCRPPNNRDPNANEVASCTPFLLEQITLLQPKLIIALGRIAAHFLLETNQSLAKLRGRLLTYQPAKLPLLATYHPAYLLRNPRDKSKAWQDWQLLQQQLVKE